jgi:hypothetical protein
MKLKEEIAERQNGAEAAGHPDVYGKTAEEKKHTPGVDLNIAVAHAASCYHIPPEAKHDEAL